MLTNHVEYLFVYLFTINNFLEAHEIIFEDLLFFLWVYLVEKHNTNKHKIYFMIETVERNAMKNWKKKNRKNSQVKIIVYDMLTSLIIW